MKEEREDDTLKHQFIKRVYNTKQRSEEQKSHR